MKLRARAWTILALVTLACVGIGASFAASGRAHNDAGDGLSFKVESTPLLGVASFRTTTISIPTFPYASGVPHSSSGLAALTPIIGWIGASTMALSPSRKIINC